MFKPVASLGLLSILAACSAGTGEAVDTTHEAIYLAFANLSVTPTDTTITIAYAEPGRTPLAVTLGNQTLYATVNPSGRAQNQSVVFTGLAPCQSYSWSIPAASGKVTGQTNTRWTGNTACADSERVFANERWTFVGAEHQEQNNIGCGNWSSSWPVGYGWTANVDPPGQAYGPAIFGYKHFSNGSSFCAESTVEAWRTNLVFLLSDAQMNRGVTGVVLHGKYTSQGNKVTATDPVCTRNLAFLQLQTWPGNSQMGEWATIVSGGASTTAVAPTGQWGWGIGADGKGDISITYAASAGPRFLAGFASPNDGFGDPMGGQSPQWAADNDTCITSVTELGLQVSYKPMPPETPLCTAAISCNTATVTCAPSPETFVLESAAGTVLGTFDATGGATPTFTVTSGGPTSTYRACTRNSAGTEACKPVAVVSNVACPPPPPCQPRDCAGAQATCGSVPDGCGGLLQCGVCAAGLFCAPDYACQKCAGTTHYCAPGEYFDSDTCSCMKLTCECGGVYPKCAVCQ